MCLFCFACLAEHTHTENKTRQEETRQDGMWMVGVCVCVWHGHKTKTRSVLNNCLESSNNKKSSVAD